MAFVAGYNDEWSVDLFFESVVDHLKRIVSDHGSLVNDDGIVLPDVIVDNVLLVRP